MVAWVVLVHELDSTDRGHCDAVESSHNKPVSTDTDNLSLAASTLSSHSLQIPDDPEGCGVRPDNPLAGAAKPGFTVTVHLSYTRGCPVQAGWVAQGTGEGGALPGSCTCCPARLDLDFLESDPVPSVLLIVS